MKFGDVTIEIALAQHSTIQPGLTDIYASLYQNDSPPYSDEEKKEVARVRSLGTFDPKVITEGTLAWVDLGLEPLFDRIRAKMPSTSYVAPLYRSPICISAGGPDQGKIVSFKY